MKKTKQSKDQSDDRQLELMRRIGEQHLNRDFNNLLRVLFQRTIKMVRSEYPRSGMWDNFRWLSL